MLLMAKGRGFSPNFVLFAGWYVSLENLKQVRDHGWRWLTRLKVNRQVAPADRVCRSLDEVAFGIAGQVVHLRGEVMDWSRSSESTLQTAWRSIGQPAI